MSYVPLTLYGPTLADPVLAINEKFHGTPQISFFSFFQNFTNVFQPNFIIFHSTVRFLLCAGATTTLHFKAQAWKEEDILAYSDAELSVKRSDGPTVIDMPSSVMSGVPIHYFSTTFLRPSCLESFINLFVTNHQLVCWLLIDQATVSSIGSFRTRFGEGLTFTENQVFSCFCRSQVCVTMSFYGRDKFGSSKTIR